MGIVASLSEFVFFIFHLMSNENIDSTDQNWLNVTELEHLKRQMKELQCVPIINTILTSVGVDTNIVIV